MADHTTTIVPLEAWAYHSPRLSRISSPIRLPNGDYVLMNIQGEDQKQRGWFDAGVLGKASLQNLLPDSRQRRALLAAMRDRVIEVKASQFGAALDNAHADILDPERSTLIVQAFADEVVDFVALPEIRAKVEVLGDKHQINVEC